MKRMTLGYAALVSAAVVSVGSLGANASPHAAATSVDPQRTRANTLQLAQQQIGQISTALGLSNQEQLVVKDAVTDPDGTKHLRYDRTYGGLRVIGGDVVVHQAKTGETRSVDRATTAQLNLSTTPAVAAPIAAHTATESQPGTRWTQAAPTLVVYAIGQQPTLAWETFLTGVKADQTPTELHVISDATNGKVLLTYDDIHDASGTGATTYSGTVPLDTTQAGSTFQLKDPTRGNQAVNNLNHATSGSGTLFTDADNKWGNGTPSDLQTAAADAAYGAAKTWDYYKNTHGRSGIKNNGVGALSKVHYGNNYANAFWNDSCFCMTYGDGTGNAKPLTSLDVAGHEMSHGVTSATAGLVYSGESGGLNEATSDIFGTAVEFAAANSTDTGDYLIGEKIDIHGNGTPLRYMDKPSKDGKSADNWSATVGTLDVHYSSGVANHFFYLLSEGSGQKTINGVAYDSPTANGASVTGMGHGKAEKIWYRALTVYFTSATNYALARVATLNAATDLYGASSTEYAAVAKAWTAVNVK